MQMGVEMENGRKLKGASSCLQGQRLWCILNIVKYAYFLKKVRLATKIEDINYVTSRLLQKGN